MRDKIFSILFILLLIATIGLTVFSCTGCNSFKKIDSGISMECDVYMTTLRTLGGKGGGNESTFVGTVYPPCAESIKLIRQKERDLECAKEFFPPDGVIDRENLRAYNRYLECRQSK